MFKNMLVRITETHWAIPVLVTEIWILRSASNNYNFRQRCVRAPLHVLYGEAR